MPIGMQQKEVTGAGLWDFLASLNSGLSTPWMLGGDFNAILPVDDWDGGASGRHGVGRGFGNFVFDNGLMDGQFKGPWFTWVRGSLRQRLDRFLVNEAWLHVFPESFTTHLNYPDFADSLRSWWPANAEVTESIGVVQSKHMDWNKTMFGSIGKKKRQLISRIQGIDRALAHRDSAFLSNLESNLVSELVIVLDNEESLWFQKSRCNCYLQGDRNTKFYHAFANNTRRVNRISSLWLVNGEWSSDPTILQRITVEFYSNLFSSENDGGYTYHVRGQFAPLSSEDIRNLSMAVGNEEVQSAVSQ
ncbi:uncharacterized protein LOC120125042 [Hibiscus syriacus]|uniref:uncharacterized protein LOC120125042 n=1 Tax=Hibiscus syriacus TaxID=106335 RepID=UPI001920C6E7|nr:uncharacterized protein LOC120125042 [Hibiscus syriacus]